MVGFAVSILHVQSNRIFVFAITTYSMDWNRFPIKGGNSLDEVETSSTLRTRMRYKLDFLRTRAGYLRQA